MFMLLLTIAVVGASTYLWLTRGFFSALLHLVCTVAAGAIAFGVWEPVSYLLIDLAADRGFGARLVDVAWALGLILPFAISLAVLRVAVDTVLPANAQCGTTADYAGGAVCGLGSGVITAGMIVLSLGFLRVPHDFGGYQLVKNEGTTERGSLEINPSKVMPWVDRLTAGFYSHVSTRTLRTGTPLAVWHPDFATLPATMRLTYEGVSRVTHKPSAFAVAGAYTVGDVQRGTPANQLLVDGWNNTPQRATDLRGRPIEVGHLLGLVVTFNAAARETKGYVSVGNGQVRLVAVNDAGESRAIHPIAVITNRDDPAVKSFERFRFASDKQFYSSVGAVAETVMAFEFPMPTGFRPLALYVKGVRADVSQAQPTNFPTPMARDAAVVAGQVTGMKDIGPIIDPNTGQPVQTQQSASVPTLDDQPIRLAASLGFNIQKGHERGLTVEAAQRRGWQIVDGEAQYFRREVEQRFDQNLLVNSFRVPPGTTMVQVNFTPLQRESAFGQALDAAERLATPLLVDANGRPTPISARTGSGSASAAIRMRSTGG
ncbi:hypothetical protein J4558_18890 [Leptolyngbya sp. 15MV]|nr:hypothetical protein J4558_18890 [Leptolyngbya sp. 15MV]